MTKTQLTGVELLLAALAVSAWLAVLMGQSGCAGASDHLRGVASVHVTTDPTQRYSPAGDPVYGECKTLDSGQVEIWVHAGSMAAAEGRELSRRDVWQAIQLARDVVTSCAPTAYLSPAEWPSTGPAPGPTSEPTTTAGRPSKPTLPPSMPLPADAGAQTPKGP